MPSAPCRRGCSRSSWGSRSSEDCDAAPARPRDRLALGLGVALEEHEEGGVLGEEVLDLGDAGAGPVLDPGVGEVVLDAMEPAFAHAGMIDPMSDVRHGPIGST